jgi:hypothetical protein
MSKPVHLPLSDAHIFKLITDSPSIVEQASSTRRRELLLVTCTRFQLAGYQRYAEQVVIFIL